jgi:hypothetical protein
VSIIECSTKKDCAKKTSFLKKQFCTLVAAVASQAQPVVEKIPRGELLKTPISKLLLII